MSVSEREYDRLEDPRWVHGPIWLSISAVLLDRLVSVLFWGLESNPVVTHLGIFRWVGLTLVLILGMLFAWYTSNGVDSGIVRGLVYLVGIVHLAAAVSNVYVALVV